MSSESTDVVSALLEAKTNLLHTLSEAKEIIKKHEDTFIDDHIGVLMNGITIYGTLFKKCGCKDQAEFEVIIRKGNRKVMLLAEEILDAEEEWIQFVKEVEKTLSPEEGSQVLLKTGDLISMDYILYPVRRIHEQGIPLRDVLKCCEGKYLLMEKLASYGLRVVVLTFGCSEGGQKWLEDTKCRFPLFTDPTRGFYRTFGLKRSVIQVWSLENVKYYASKIAQEIPLVGSYPGIKDDIHQMGGDFIIDSEGKLILAYRSRFPADRPSIDIILESIK